MTNGKRGIAPNETTTLFPVFPQLQWNDRDYATLKGRLHLFSDYLVMEKFNDGRPGEMYIVDPLDIAARLNGAIGLTSGLLPQGCLFWGTVGGQERLGIYVEPQVWPVSVEGEKLTWHVPMPGLVVIGQDRTYHFFAAGEPGWPGPETRLYVAPCPNLGSRGVCRGNAPFPVASIETMREAVKVFFESGFNRDLSDNKSKAYPKCVLEKWRALHTTQAITYPTSDLMDARLTLKGLIYQKGGE